MKTITVGERIAGKIERGEIRSTIIPFNTVYPLANPHAGVELIIVGPGGGRLFSGTCVAVANMIIERRKCSSVGVPIEGETLDKLVINCGFRSYIDLCDYFHVTEKKAMEALMVAW